MRLIIESTPERVARWTARYIVEQIRQKEKYTASPFVLGLPTGSTPLETYRGADPAPPCRRGVVLQRRDVQHGRIRRPARGAPQSYHTFMRENFAHVDIRPENTHLLDGNAEDLAKECADYEARIAECGGIDLFLGGVGEDGHIAFNEPFSSLSSRTRIKTLTQDTVAANARFFGGDESLVPRTAPDRGRRHGARGPQGGHPGHGAPQGARRAPRRRRPLQPPVGPYRHFRCTPTASWSATTRRPTSCAWPPIAISKT